MNFYILFLVFLAYFYQFGNCVKVVCKLKRVELGTFASTKKYTLEFEFTPFNLKDITPQVGLEILKNYATKSHLEISEKITIQLRAWSYTNMYTYIKIKNSGFIPYDPKEPSQIPLTFHDVFYRPETGKYEISYIIEQLNWGGFIIVYDGIDTFEVIEPKFDKTYSCQKF